MQIKKWLNFVTYAISILCEARQFSTSLTLYSETWIPGPRYLENFDIRTQLCPNIESNRKYFLAYHATYLGSDLKE
jgi:hypothetical protein